MKFVLRRAKILQNRLKQWSDTTDDDNKLFGDYYYSGPLYNTLLEYRRKLAKFSKDEGILPVLVIFNANVQYSDNWQDTESYRLLHKGLAKLGSEMGYIVLDMYPYYQKVLKDNGWDSMKAIWINEEDHHPNPRGHTYIAQALIELFTTNQELVERFSDSR